MSRIDWIAAVVRHKGGSVKTAIKAYKAGATAHRAILAGMNK